MNRKIVKGAERRELTYWELQRSTTRYLLKEYRT
jgi:hypothetical protein